MSWRGLHWAMLFAGLVLLLLTAESYGDGGLSMFLSQMLILLSVFSILESFDLSWVERVPAIGFIDRCSFGIFIFHYWLGPYMISTTAKRIFPIEAMFAAHPYISPFCFFLATMAASIVATLLLLRTRVGRFLIG